MIKYIVIEAINERIQTPKAFNSRKEAVEEVKKRINRESFDIILIISNGITPTKLVVLF